MPTVFLSYSRADLPLIEQLEAQLTVHPDISIWRDQEKIYGGQKWPKVLGEAIADQDVFLLAWSKNSADSLFIEFEWTTALALKKTVISCLLDNSPLPASLRDIPAIAISDVGNIVGAITSSSLAQDTGRREEVLSLLDQTTAGSLEDTLHAARSLLDQRNWTVQGNVIQGEHVTVHVGKGSKSSAMTLLENWRDWLGFAAAILGLLISIPILKPSLELTTPVPSSTTEIAAQPKLQTLGGAIRDEDSHPLVGVQVSLPKFTLTTTTDPLGQFRFEVTATEQETVRTQGSLGNVLGRQGTRTSGTPGTQLLAKAVAAYRAALKVYTRDQLPHEWAMVQNNLGAMLGEQGIRTSSTHGTQLLAAAVDTYRAVLTVYTKDQLPHEWASAQNNLGNVLREQGIRTSGTPDIQLLADAVAAYRAALTVYTKDQLPQEWAMAQNNLGNVLRDQSVRTKGETNPKLLVDAVDAYRAALTVRTREHVPEDWAETHHNLAKTAVLLEDWRTAAESYHNVLALHPDDEETYRSVHLIYQGKLFAHQTAFEITKNWLDKHPENLSAQANFAVAHLTTGRFEDAARRLGELLKKPSLSPTSSVGLRIEDIVVALALKKPTIVPQKLQELRTFVSWQPETFYVDWNFDGPKHHILSEPVFASYRPWLMYLFASIKSRDRATLLAALDHVQASFKP
ncbi:MAG: TIR domain-containing protein [Nitrospira sp.]|nr:MAG: TIR domain-containing protein [Nitrospira sp.]